MLVKVWPEQNQPPEQVEDVFLADELPARFGLDQHAIEFVQPAFGDHINVGHDLVALGVTDQVNIQASGMVKDAGFYV